MRICGLMLMLLVACATDPEPQKKEDRQQAADFDVRIVGGMLIDGSGAARVRADVGIKGDTIVSIGDLSKKTSRETIDASGLIVAPGFIDLLGHSEGAVLIDPKLEGKVRQGVTTEVTGEGHSPGPITDAMAAEMMKERPAGYPDVTWRSLGEYMTFLESRGSAINFAFYIGATSAREIVLGKTNRQPTPAEMKRMEKIVDRAMQEGAVGLSSALVYVPALYATTDELVRLASVAAKHGGGYFTHMRNESDRIDAALDEAFTISRKSGAPLNIFHLKIGGRHNWGKMGAIVDKIEAQRRSGLDVASNVYPYIATATGLTSLAPDWALEGGYTAFQMRLKDPAQRARIAREIRESSFYNRIGGASGVLVRRLPAAPLKIYEKKKLDVIFKEMSSTRKGITDAVDALLVLFDESPQSPTALYFSMSEDDVRTALRQPWVAVGSDSGAVVGDAVTEGAHPRAYGTFPRILGRYAREERLFSTEEAIRKMTSLAAQRAGFSDRGLIRENLKADIVVFDENTIIDRSTYEDPHHYSEGISDVLVNGVPVLRRGVVTGRLPGRVLRHGTGNKENK